MDAVMTMHLARKEFGFSAVADALQLLNIAGTESEVYCLLARNGAATAGSVARRLRLNRGHTYTVLHSLVSKELVREAAKDGVKHFIAIPPASVLDLLVKREKDLSTGRVKLQSALSDLTKHATALEQSAFLEVLSGSERIMNALLSLLDGCDEALCCLHDQNDSGFLIRDEYASFRKKFTKRRTDQGIWLRSLVSALEPAQPEDDQINRRSIRYVIGGSEWGAEVFISPTRSLIIPTPAAFGQALVVHTPLLNSLLLNLHETLWQNCR